MCSIKHTHDWQRPGSACKLLRSASREREAPFQVALLDMQMPGMGGLELTEEIKADAALSPRRNIIIMHTVGRRGQLGVVGGGGHQRLRDQTREAVRLLRCHHGRGCPEGRPSPGP